MARRALDAYMTPAQAVKALLAAVDIAGGVLEPCCGDQAMALALLAHPPVQIVGVNDIDPKMAHRNEDATAPAFWEREHNRHDWIVTNPPFNVASKIVPQAFLAARRGVAMLLRLTFLEPCGDREHFLSVYPPSQLIVLPRMSFTGDGKTDSVTCAWMVWDKDIEAQQGITVVPKSQLRDAA